MISTDRNKHSQKKKFQDAARELGCDEDDKAFDQKLKKVAAAQPPKTKKSKTNKTPAK